MTGPPGCIHGLEVREQRTGAGGDVEAHRGHGGQVEGAGGVDRGRVSDIGHVVRHVGHS